MSFSAVIFGGRLRWPEDKCPPGNRRAPAVQGGFGPQLVTRNSQRVTRNSQLLASDLAGKLFGTFPATYSRLLLQACISGRGRKDRPRFVQERPPSFRDKFAHKLASKLPKKLRSLPGSNLASEFSSNLYLNLNLNLSRSSLRLLP